MPEAGTLVNATGRYQNAYDATSYTAFNPPNTLTPGMKTYYDTTLLENARPKLIYQQLGRQQALPMHHGKSVEWRKWNTLPEPDELTEAVIPTGKKLGQTTVTTEIKQYGEYVAVSDVLDTHYVDDVIQGATEELGAAMGTGYEKLVIRKLMTGTNVLFADAYTAAGAYDSTPATRAALRTALATKKAYVTPDMINKAVTILKKANAPAFSGKYVAVIHPSCTYDLRSHKDWIGVHQYAAVEQIFTGEIGELHGVRFIERTLAPCIKNDVEGATIAIYQTMFFGKDAFAVVDPEGAGMETIIKTRDQVGGPLNQFSTVGAKFSMGAAILYPERYLILESGSTYSTTDTDNITA